jgi:16S rRNA (guanine966-N2)-methyltransferase
VRIESGRFRGRLLPRAAEARPVPGRLRGSLFSALGDRLPGARVLDLFAGIGALGLEALSRGAAEVVLVERDRRAADALERWLEAVGARGEAKVVCADALRRPLPEGPFDLVFADPPYALWDGDELLPVLRRAVGTLGPQGLLVLKVPAKREVPADPAWVVLRRRAMGSNAWVLVGPVTGRGGGGAPPDPSGFPSSVPPAGPMVGGS